MKVKLVDGDWKSSINMFLDKTASQRKQGTFREDLRSISSPGLSWTGWYDSGSFEYLLDSIVAEEAAGVEAAALAQGAAFEDWAEAEDAGW